MPDAALPSITLLLSHAKPLWVADLQAAVVRLGAVSLGGVIDGIPIEDSEAGLSCTITWGQHRVRCLQVLAPAPGLAEVIQSSRTEHAALEPLKNQRSHVLCFYTGMAPDPVDRVIALFQLANACQQMGLLGIIHTDAEQCFQAEAIGSIVSPECLADLHGQLAQPLLCNLIPFYTQSGTWWTSRGNHIFGVPDITLWDDGSIGHEVARAIQGGLFTYLRNGAQMRIGDTMEAHGMTLKAGPVTEYADRLSGPGETLAIRSINAMGGQSATDQEPPPSPGCMIAVFVAAAFFAALIFGVPSQHYTWMKVTLGLLSALCCAFGVLLIMASRRR